MNASPKQTNNLAIISLISGILGWTVLPWLGSIVAIVTGHMARAEIARNQETMEGDGLAVGGLVLGWSMLVLSFIGLMLVILFFGGIAVLLGWLRSVRPLELRRLRVLTGPAFPVPPRRGTGPWIWVCRPSRPPTAAASIRFWPRAPPR